jgi:hypothetical protein
MLKLHAANLLDSGRELVPKRRMEPDILADWQWWIFQFPIPGLPTKTNSFLADARFAVADSSIQAHTSLTFLGATQRPLLDLGACLSTHMEEDEESNEATSGGFLYS